MKKTLLILIGAFILGCVAQGKTNEGPTSTDAYLYQDGKLAISGSGELVIQDSSGKELFRSQYDGTSGVNLPLDVAQLPGIRISLNGVSISIQLVNPQMRLRLYDPNGKLGTAPPMIFVHGSNWTQDYETEKSALNLALLKDLSATNPIYLCEYTLGANITIRADYCAAEYKRLESRQPRAILGISQGGVIVNSMLKAGIKADSVINLVVPNQGIKSDLTAMGYGAYQLLSPEMRDMLTGSAYYGMMDGFMLGERSNAGYYTIAINTRDNNDMLIMNASTHAYTSAANQITVNTGMSHLDMDQKGTQLFPAIVRDILNGRTRNVYNDAVNLAGTISVAGLTFAIDGYGRYSLASGSLPVEVTIDPTANRLIIDNVVAGYYDSISNGVMIGYNPAILPGMPAIVARAIPVTNGIQFEQMALALTPQGGVTGYASFVYGNASLKGRLLAQIAITRTGVKVTFLSAGSLLMSVSDQFLINWQISSMTLGVENGEVMGNILVTGGARYEYNKFNRLLGDELEGTIRKATQDFIKGRIVSLVKDSSPTTKNLINNDINPISKPISDVVDRQADAIAKPITDFLVNNAEISRHFEISLNATLQLGYLRGIVSIDANVNANFDGKLALHLFHAEVASITGAASATVALGTANLSAYLEFTGKANGNGQGKILFLPILGGSAEADLYVRVNFNNPDLLATARLKYHYVGQALGVISLLDEKGNMEVKVYTNNRYYMGLMRDYWDIARSLHIEGSMNFHKDAATGMVTVDKSDFWAAGRAATVYNIDRQAVQPIFGLGYVGIPEVRMKAYLDISIPLPCGRVTLLRTAAGETWMPEMRFGI
jgi:hypothetical protein